MANPTSRPDCSSRGAGTSPRWPRLPNVDCKLSGLITEADHAAWTIDHLRPYVDHVLATFGPHRLLFGGDWPVVKLAGTYARWLDTARALVSHLSPPAQAAVFHDNALRVYRLAVTSDE